MRGKMVVIWMILMMMQENLAIQLGKSNWIGDVFC